MAGDYEDPEGYQTFYKVRSDGTRLKEVLYPSGSDPVFSPDGTKIAFIGYIDGGFNVITANRDATGQENVTGYSFESGRSFGAFENRFRRELRPNFGVLLKAGQRFEGA